MLPSQFNLSFTRLRSLWAPRRMKRTGDNRRLQMSSPPPAHSPLSGPTARTPQDWPGQRARRIYLLWFIVFLVETWDLLKRMGRKTVGQKLGVESKHREGRGS